MELILLTRDNCLLCDEMKAIIDLVRQTHHFDLTEVDISTNPALTRQFGTEIPVLLHGDRVVARHKITKNSLIDAIGEQRGTK